MFNITWVGELDKLSICKAGPVVGSPAVCLKYVYAVSQGNRRDTRNNSILHYMHQMLVLAFRVVEDGDKVQMSARGTLLPSQAVPKYSPQGVPEYPSTQVPKQASNLFSSTEVWKYRSMYSKEKPPSVQSSKTFQKSLLWRGS